MPMSPSSTAAIQPDYKVRDLSLADSGRRAIEVAEKEMPGLMAVREKYAPAEAARGRARSRAHCT